MRIIRFVIIMISLVILALLLHLIVYRLDFSIINASNVLFVVGIIVFMPSLVAMTSSYRVFTSMRYAVRVILSPQFKHEYPTFKDYKEEKEKEIKTTLFFEMMVASLSMMVASAILAWMWF